MEIGFRNPDAKPLEIDDANQVICTCGEINLHVVDAGRCSPHQIDIDIGHTYEDFAYVKLSCEHCDNDSYITFCTYKGTTFCNMQNVPRITNMEK